VLILNILEQVYYIMAKIHSTAIVDPRAKIADDVEIGPYCIVGGDVELGSGCRLISQCNVVGHTVMGKNNVVHPFANIGGPPQDYSYDENSVSYLRIGDNNIFREGFTANPSAKAGGETVIGSNCFFLAYSHVAHDCHVGNCVIMVNFSGLTGHVEVGDFCLISGQSGIHQFCRMGRMAVLSGGSQVSMDIPPFMIADGRNGGIRGINLVGLRRRGFEKDTIRALKDLYDIMFRSGLNTSNALKKVKEELPQLPEIVEFIEFVESSKRGVLQGRGASRRA
jgi:UDP-N-acetylglucosamine acyltransferase